MDVKDLSRGIAVVFNIQTKDYCVCYTEVLGAGLKERWLMVSLVVYGVRYRV